MPVFSRRVWAGRALTLTATAGRLRRHRRKVRLRNGRSELLTATTAVANPIGPWVVLCGAGYQCVCGSGHVLADLCSGLVGVAGFDGFDDF